MNNKYLLAYLIIIASILGSCLNKNGQQENKVTNIDKKWVKKFYPSGKLYSSGFYIKDTIPIDTLSYFYEDGNLYSTEVRNDKGILNGVVKAYYENGEVSLIKNYINDSVQGWGYYLYENGKTKCRAYYLNNKHAGDTYFYNEDGTYKSYYFFDFFEKGRSKIRWNSVSGKIIEKIYPVIFIDSIKQSDKDINLWDIDVLISNPPKSHTNVTIDYISTKNNLMESDTINNNIPYYHVEKRFADTLSDVKILSSQYDSITKKVVHQGQSIKFE